MENTQVLEQLFDNKVLKILKLFLNNKEKQFYLREVSKKSGVPLATTSRMIKKLTDIDIVRRIEINKFKLYTLSRNKSTEFLEDFLREDKQVLNIFVDMIKGQPGIEEIILHGEIRDNKANLLLIGENIQNGEIKTLCADIKEKYKFMISSLSLQREQFQQMSKMGLYNEKKQTLFRKQAEEIK